MMRGHCCLEEDLIMEIKMTNIRIRNLANLMKYIRELEDTEVFSGALWRSPESIREDTLVYYVGVDGLLIDTGRGYYFVRKDAHGINITDWTDSDWVVFEFDNVFTGSFMDACKFVLDRIDNR
jgi:hypothetical protein